MLNGDDIFIPSKINNLVSQKKVPIIVGGKFVSSRLNYKEHTIMSNLCCGRIILLTMKTQLKGQSTMKMII